MKGIERLKSGDFNTMNQAWQKDGSVIITLSWPDGQSQFQVKNLYKADEQVMWEKTGAEIEPSHNPLKVLGS